MEMIVELLIVSMSSGFHSVYMNSGFSLSVRSSHLDAVRN